MTKCSFGGRSGSEGQVGSLFQREEISFRSNIDNIRYNLNEETVVV